MSFTANHLAWQQRVATESRMQRINIENGMKDNYMQHPVEDSQLYDLYKKVIQDQLARERSIKVGSNPMIRPQQHTYTYGGSSRIQATPMTAVPQQVQQGQQPKDHFGLLTEVNRHRYIGKRSELNIRPCSSGSGAMKYKRAKAFYPKDYYNRVGYQASDAESVYSAKGRTDALGQRVRQRFNEEVDYKENGQVHPTNRLDRKSLGQMSGRASNAGLGSQASRRSAAASQVGSAVGSERRRPHSQIAYSSASRSMARARAFQAAEEQKNVDLTAQEPTAEVAEEVAATAEEPQAEGEQEDPYVDAGSQVKTTVTKDYIAQLEMKLAEEQDARSRMEQEVEELKRVNAEISSKLGLSSTHEDKQQ